MSFGKETEYFTDTIVHIPRMYAVIIHNDDYTPMEFVVKILMKVFRKPEHEATEIMASVHLSGSGVAGVYPLDIAQTKLAIAEQMSVAEGYPLRFSVAEETQ